MKTDPSIFSIFGLDIRGTDVRAPVVGARLVSNEDPPEPPPKDMRCIYFSKLTQKWYVRIERKGKRHQRAFFNTPEEALVAREKLRQELGKSPARKAA